MNASVFLKMVLGTEAPLGEEMILHQCFHITGTAN